MNKAVINTGIYLDDSTSNPTIGYLTIHSTETINIDKISGQFFLEIRGMMYTQKKGILLFDVSNQKTIPKNELQTLSFEIDLSDIMIHTYRGKNVSFTYKCEIEIDVNENDINKLERDIFSKVKSLLRYGNSIKVSEYINIENPIAKYQVVEKKANFSPKLNKFILLYSVLITGFICVGFMPEYNQYYLIWGLCIVAFLTSIIYIIYSLGQSTFGVVSMETIREEDAFLCKIKRTNKFNLVNQYIYYEIIEKVIDKRGTTSSTYNEVIYTSDKKKLPNSDEDTIVKFKYPKKKNLPSLKYEDVSILWTMNLEGSTFLGLELEYFCEFIVERE